MNLQIHEKENLFPISLIIKLSKNVYYSSEKCAFTLGAVMWIGVASNRGIFKKDNDL
jgi:hypothetical protein